MGLDAEARTAKLQGGEVVGFGKALLATGANVNILRVDGAELDGIHYLRVHANSDAIRDEVADEDRVVLIGGSYIACEVAASLTEMGKSCTLVMQEDKTLERSFGAAAGGWFDSLLRSKGIEIVAGDELGRFLGEGRVQAVVTGSGREIECDTVIVGAGVHPDTMLAKRAGIEVGDGVICDSGLESSVEGIFAAGDCCSYESEIHGRRLRVEHWDVAFNQGKHAAKGMLGDKRPYRVVPYFFSDLSDWAAIEYVGPAAEWDEEIWRGDRDAGEFSVFYMSGGRVAGALSVGRSEDLQAARGWIESGADVSEHRDAIGDTDTDLSELAG
jgi:3-phenylpropionate/trans-cinnamate dioxygenase ferredoxin reductase subunit